MTNSNINTQTQTTIEMPEWIYFALCKMVEDEGLETVDDAIMLLMIRDEK